MNPYLKNQIETSTPEQILILLYDGAIKNLMQSKIFIEKKEIENSHNCLIKAQKIIQELQNSLNKDINTELYENLSGLYSYYIKRLIEANIKKDINPIDEVIEHLKGLRDTWKKAILENNKVKAETYNYNDDNEDSYYNS